VFLKFFRELPKNRITGREKPEVVALKSKIYSKRMNWTKMQLSRNSRQLRLTGKTMKLNIDINIHSSTLMSKDDFFCPLGHLYQ
jgi:hypothetical protein